MATRRSRRAPLAALAALALAAALAAPRGDAGAEAPTAVTTTLRPGWNMAAWLGPDAPVQAIFGEIPQLVRAQAWDAAARRYRIANRRSIPADGLERLTAGMGLWLWIGGREEVAWERPALAGGALLDLRAGRHLVGWAGRDGATAAEAFAGFGGALAAAERWNAEARRYDRYRPGAPPAANTLRALRHGDAIAIALTSGARWLQPDAPPPSAEFPGGASGIDRAFVGGWIARARALFAERWGAVTPAAFVVGADREALAPRYLEARGRPLPAGFCADYGGGAVFALIGCLSEPLIARQYFHAVRDALDGEGPASPRWLTEGAAEYAERIAAAPPGGLAAHMARERGRAAARLAGRDAVPPLAALETSEGFAAHGEAGYDLGFLAAEWLAAFFASDAPLIDYFRRLAEAAGWREAFEAAFGFTAANYLELFEAYRAALAPTDSGGGGGPG